MSDLDYAVKAILDSAHQRVQAEITAAVADGADLYERVTAALSPPTDETAKLRREVAELKAKLKSGKAGEVVAAPRPQPPAMPALTLSPQIEMPTPTIIVSPAEPAAQPVIVDVTPFIEAMKALALEHATDLAALHARLDKPPTVVKTVVRDEHGRALRVIEETQ